VFIMWGRNKRLYFLIVIFIVAPVLILLHTYNNQQESFQKEGPNNIAILFSGRIKGYTYIEQHLDALQKKYNATFFISLNKEQRSEYIDNFCKKFNIGDDQAIIEKTISPEWIRSFNVEYHVPEGKEGSHVDNMYSMVQNIYSAFNLIAPYQEKHNTQFDCILFYRADIHSEEIINITMPVENTVYIPEDFDWLGGINYQIAYGNYDAMKKYCDLVNNLQKLCGEQRISYHPETLLKKHLENEGLTIVRFPYNYSLHPKRHESIPEYDDIP
jgi:hypothetical protein